MGASFLWQHTYCFIENEQAYMQQDWWFKWQVSECTSTISMVITILGHFPLNYPYSFFIPYWLLDGDCAVKKGASQSFKFIRGNDYESFWWMGLAGGDSMMSTLWIQLLALVTGSYHNVILVTLMVILTTITDHTHRTAMSHSFKKNILRTNIKLLFLWVLFGTRQEQQESIKKCWIQIVVFVFQTNLSILLTKII